MITVRPSAERGYFDHGWLKTYHSFSFDQYHDPRYMGFHSLRVINQDRVAPGQGFGMHRHKNMEILTYVISGSIKHNDSLGNEYLVKPGEIQRMSAGTGIQHSEVNPSVTEWLELLQIWLHPNTLNLSPSYEQKTIQRINNQLTLLASPTGEQNSVLIHQDAKLYLGVITTASKITYPAIAARHYWIQVIKGELTVNTQLLSAGDGAGISDEATIEISNATKDNSVEFLLFDLGE